MRVSHFGAKVMENYEGGPWRQGRQQCGRLGPLSWELLHWDPLPCSQQKGRKDMGFPTFTHRKWGLNIEEQRRKTYTPKATVAKVDIADVSEILDREYLSDMFTLG